VAYDEGLAARLRDAIVGTADVTERKMFGGLAFLVGGHMAIAASHDGGLLVRVDPAESERLVRTSTATPMIMQGREMVGWLCVPADAVRTKRELLKRLRLGVAHAGSLPPKPGSRTSR
jgi:TfoX/Sxy family transcriptional regulator of competence genes